MSLHGPHSANSDAMRAMLRLANDVDGFSQNEIRGHCFLQCISALLVTNICYLLFCFLASHEYMLFVNLLIYLENQVRMYIWFC